MPVLTRNLVKRNAYFDSVVLMRIAAELGGRAGVAGVSLMMGTQANRELLAAADLMAPEGEAAGPNDLVIAVRADQEQLDGLLAEADAALDTRAPTTTGQAEIVRPRTLEQAAGANLAMISVPGSYAAAEALKALKMGMHVFLFSDNVFGDAELELKEEAGRRGLLVMGPDCGTAIIGGIPLGFANAVRRGDIGIIGASGTGSQEIACLADAGGAGISHLLGVGGHDLSETIGGRSMLAAFEALDADPSTRVIVLVSKPPAESVAARVLERARRSAKPVVVNFLGAQVEAGGNLHAAATLAEAAALAVSLSRGRPLAQTADLPVTADLTDRIGPGRTAVRALFSGGTFAYQAKQLLDPVAGSMEHGVAGRSIHFPPGDLVLDLGDDEFTVGRPHPMIDPTLRVEFLRAALAAPDTAVVLLDVVLGTGSAPDPAGALAPALREAHGPLVIAFVCGTEADAQGLEGQRRQLREAGAIVAPSSTAATRLAVAIRSHLRAQVS